MLIGTLAAALGVFSVDSVDIFPVLRREHNAGTSLLAALLAIDFVDALVTLLYAFAFTSTYFLVASPFGSFAPYFFLIFAYVHSMNGVGYLFASLLSTNSAGE